MKANSFSKRLPIRIILILLIFVALFGCKSSSRPPAPLPQQQPTDGQQPTTVPLKFRFVFAAASPNTGDPLLVVGQAPLEVRFNVQVVGGVPPYTYVWDYTNDYAEDKREERTNSNTSLANFVYGATGTYNARVDAIDSANTMVSKYFTVRLETISPLWVSASYSPLIATEGSRVTFTSSVLRKINILDIKIGNVYATPLINPITLQTIIGANTTITEGNLGLLLNLLGNPANPESIVLTTIPDASLLVYSWDFNGDGITDSNQPNPFFTYSTEGKYTVKLTVLNKKDNTTSTSTTSELTVVKDTTGQVQPPQTFSAVWQTFPQATNGVVNIFEGGSVEFSALGSGGTSPYVYFWDFTSDGQFDSLSQSPTVPYYDSRLNRVLNPYEVAGTYFATLVVKDNTGNSLTYTIIITVKDPDVSGQQLTASVGLEPQGTVPYLSQPDANNKYPFDLKATVSGGTTPFNYLWDWADGSPPLIGEGFVNPGPHEYTRVNYYNIRFQAVDSSSPIQSEVLYFPVSVAQVTDGTNIVKVDEPNGLVPLIPRSRFGYGVAQIPLGGLLEGDIIVFGGYNSNVAINNVQVIRFIPPSQSVPATDPWFEVRDLAAMPTKRGDVAFAMVNNTIYAFGGRNEKGDIISNTESLDLSTVNLLTGEAYWSFGSKIGAPAFQLALAGAGAAAIGTDIYLTGGVYPLGFNTEFINERLLRYDTSSDSWTSNLPIMPTPRYRFAAVSARDAFGNGSFFTIGGISNSGITSTVEAYSPTTGWQTLANLPTPLASAQAFLLPDTKGDTDPLNDTDLIYLVGGTTDLVTPSEKIYIYNPQTNRWTESVPLPTGAGRFDLGAGVFNLRGAGNVIERQYVITFGGRSLGTGESARLEYHFYRDLT